MTEMSSPVPFWQRVGFDRDPFEKTSAEQEEFLETYFVEPPRFWDVTGPQHAIVYASLGGGKTATRCMLEHLAAAGELGKVLIITCADFMLLLKEAQNNPRQIAPEMLVRTVMCQAASIFFDYWMMDIEAFQDTALTHRHWVASRLRHWREQANIVLQKIGLGEIVLEEEEVEPADAYSAYEAAVDELRERLGSGHAKVEELLIYQSRLAENIKAARLYGDNDTRRSERSEIIHYLNTIALAELKVSFDKIHQDTLTAKPNLLQYFQTLESQIEEDLQPWVEALASLAKQRQVPLEERSSIQWLRLLVDGARQLGFESVYVLFDKMDGLQQTKGPQECASMVAPLLDSTAMLDVPGICFKFFLPNEVHPILSGTQGVRSRRVAEVPVEWNEEKLNELWRLRLRGFSAGRIESLAAISEQRIKERVDRAVIQNSQTPRDLLIRGRNLLKSHERFSTQSSYLTEANLDALQKSWEGAPSPESVAFRGLPAAWLWILGAIVLMIATGAGMFWPRTWYLWTPLALVALISQVLFYKWSERKLPPWQFAAALVIQLALPLFVVALLPSVWPYTPGKTYTLDNPAGHVSSSHPCWGVWGGEAEIRLHAQDFVAVILVTVKFHHNQVQWPQGHSVRWTAAEVGKTKTLPVRFLTPGPATYTLTVEGGGHSTIVNGGGIYVAPVPAPLISGVIAGSGAILVLWDKVGSLIQCFLKGGNNDRDRS